MTRVLLSALIAGGRTGIPRYAVEVCRALDRIAPERPELEMRVVTTPAGAAAIDARRLPTTVVGRRVPRVDAAPVRLALEQAHRRGRAADVVHFLDFTGPLRGSGPAPFTTTVHDLKYFTHTDAYGRAQAAQKRFVARWAAARAARIVAISRFAADVATDVLGVPRARLTVIHSGPGLSPSGERRSPALAPPEGPYLLVVGTLSATKNLPFLIRAYERSKVDASLVIVGGRAAGADAVEAAAAASPRRDRIRLMGRASDADLAALYRSARALLLPSTYEGFAFTPLEAMSRGCPVVASDIPAVREISGDGAWLLPPGDLEAWAAALRAVTGDPSVGTRLRARGARTVARYSWDATGRRLAELFLEVAAESGRRPRVSALRPRAARARCGR